MRTTLYSLIITFILFSLSCSAEAKNHKEKKPFVVLKFDDLKNTNWKAWKVITDIIIEKNITADLGIFTASLNSGDEEYYNYLQSLVDDPKHFEIWFHGYAGGPKELYDADYETQLNLFRISRIEMLKKYDYILRNFGGHYYGGNEHTVRIVNEDPFLKGWVFNRSQPILPEKKVMPDRKVNMEPATAVVSYKTFNSGWIKMKADTLPYVVLQGHPWGYTTDSLKNDFIRIVDDLKSKGVTFTHFRKYDLLTKGYSADKTPPSVPKRVNVKKEGNITLLTWEPSTDKQSGIDCYKIYRDGICIDLSAAPSFIDSSESDHLYQIRAVNKNDLVSGKSKAVRSLQNRGK